MDFADGEKSSRASGESGGTTMNCENENFTAAAVQMAPVFLNMAETFVKVISLIEEAGE